MSRKIPAAAGPAGIMKSFEVCVSAARGLLNQNSMSIGSLAASRSSCLRPKVLQL